MAVFWLLYFRVQKYALFFFFCYLAYAILYVAYSISRPKHAFIWVEWKFCVKICMQINTNTHIKSNQLLTLISTYSFSFSFSFSFTDNFSVFIAMAMYNSFDSFYCYFWSISHYFHFIKKKRIRKINRIRFHSEWNFKLEKCEIIHSLWRGFH